MNSKEYIYYMVILILNKIFCFFADIAAVADQYADLLVPDEGCEYDELIELNLDEVCPCFFSFFMISQLSLDTSKCRAGT